MQKDRKTHRKNKTPKIIRKRHSKENRKTQRTKDTETEGTTTTNEGTNKHRKGTTQDRKNTIKT